MMLEATGLMSHRFCLLEAPGHDGWRLMQNTRPEPGARMGAERSRSGNTAAGTATSRHSASAATCSTTGRSTGAGSG
jgi:hypothetical protein